MNALLNGPSTGCYGLVDLHGWFPWCIKHLTRSQWAHAFIVINADDGTILEARPTGSAIGSLAQYRGCPMLFSEPAPQVAAYGIPAARLWDDASEQWTGIPYGEADIAALGLYYACHIRFRWLTDFIKDEKRAICSQLVAEWGAAYCADWSCGQPDPQFVTPGLLGARLGT